MLEQSDNLAAYEFEQYEYMQTIVLHMNLSNKTIEYKLFAANWATLMAPITVLIRVTRVHILEHIPFLLDMKKTVYFCTHL